MLWKVLQPSWVQCSATGEVQRAIAGLTHIKMLVSYICIWVVMQRLFTGTSGFTMSMDFKPLEFLLDKNDLKKYRYTISYQKP